MKKALSISLFALFLTFAAAPGAQALESYSAEQQQRFVDWCTGAKGASESTCSCTVKRLAQTVAPAALAMFLSNNGMPTLSQSAIATAASVTEALTSCSK